MNNVEPPPEDGEGSGGSRLPYIPLYIGDYLADTRRLTTLEHGAYLLLIFEYWRRGSLPADDRRLARIVGLRESEWAKIKDSIAEFFDGSWRHKRLDTDLAKARGKSASASASANARWQSRKVNDVPAECERICDRSADAKLSSSYSESDSSLPPFGRERAPTTDATPKRSKRSRTRCAMDPQVQPTGADRAAAQDADLDDAEFRTEWAKFRDWHVANGSLMANWSAAWRVWLTNRRRFGTPRSSAASTNPFLKAAEALLNEQQSADFIEGYAVSEGRFETQYRSQVAQPDNASPHTMTLAA